MKIDYNDMEIKAFAMTSSGIKEEGEALQRKFLDEIIASGEDHCPCTTACPTTATASNACRFTAATATICPSASGT